MFTLLRATALVCTLLLGAVSTANAQCEEGESFYQITLPDPSGTTFPTDISWNITEDSSGDIIIEETCPDYAGGTFDFCLTPGESYTFNALDDFGDGWGFGPGDVYFIGLFGGTIEVSGGNPTNLAIGDGTEDCIGFDTELSVSFIASEPLTCIPAVVDYVSTRNCPDFNTDISATVVQASTSSATELTFTASVDDVELASVTVPNADGEIANLEDLPLDEDIVLTVAPVGDDGCPISETLNENSIGCPVPVTCGETVDANYCYDNFDVSVFAYESEGGESLTLFFQEGLIESCCDDIFIYDGTDETGPLLFSGNNGGNLANVSVDAPSGTIYMVLDTDVSVSCASGSTSASEWNWLVGCTGDVDIPGCTDPEALNYSPAATTDDGSCQLPVSLVCDVTEIENYCYGNNENTLFGWASPSGESITISFLDGLISTFGDDIFIYDGANPELGTLLFSGNNGGDLTDLTQTAESGNLTLLVTSSAFTSCATNSGGTSEWNWVVGCGELDLPGCTDANALNFNPEATIDDGSCILPVTLDCSTPLIENYCYENNDNTFFGYSAPGDNQVVLTFDEGLIESCCDDIFIYDGLDATGELLFSGNNGGDLEGVSVTAESGNLFMVLDTDVSVACATGSFGTSEWTWTVICQPPPTCDPATFSVVTERSCENFNFEATVTIDEASPTPLALLLIAAESNGISLGGTTVPNVSGQVAVISDLPLGEDVIFTVNPLGATCPVTETVNVSDVGCPIPLTCGEAFNDNYCYTNFDTTPFVYESPDGEPIVLFFEDGLIESCCDDIFIYDGLDATGELLFSGNNGGDLAGVSVTANSGALTMILDTDLSVSCETNSFGTSEWNWIVGCGDIDIPGCTDPEAVNFSPEATVDDGSCIFAPDNDLPCDAIEITCESGNVLGTTLGATLDEDCGGADGGAGVWYVFNSTIDGTLRLNTCQDNSPNTDYDTDISVFTGTCDELTCLAYVDGEFTCGFASDITVDVFNGTTYYVQVHGWNGEGNFDMEVTCEEVILDCPGIGNIGDLCDDGDPGTVNDAINENCECAGEIPPPGTVCGGPIDVLSLPYQDINNTSGFGDDYETTDLPPLTPDAINNGFSTLYFGGDDVVYAYTPSEDQFIDVTLSNHDTWVGLFVITGCPFEATVASQTGSDNGGREFEALPVTAGTTYYIVISTFPLPQSTAYQLDIEVTSFDCPDINADFGDPCDDGIDDLFGSTIQDDCTCGGGAPFDGCTSGALFGTRTISCDDPNQDIFGSWTNEYSSIQGVESGLEYTFTLSEPSYFITVTDGTEDGILTIGQGEVVWTSDYDGTVRFYSHIDGACSTTSGSATSHTRSVSVNCDVSNPECENAMMIAATPEFSGSEVDASIADAVASGTPQCVNPDNPQADRWFQFVSVTTNMYVRADGSDDFDAVVEVYDACNGTLLNCQNDEPAGEREIVQVTGTTVGETYYFRVYHAGDDAPVQQNFSVAVAHIPFTQLSADDCGILDYTPADMITTDLPVNQFLLTNWYFEFTELEAPFNTYEVISPNGANPNFLLEWFTQAEYGRTYEVRTRARMYQGPQLGDYGDACVIGFSPTPLTTQLIEEQDLGFFNFCDILEADNVPGATTYRFKFYTGFAAQPIIYDSPTRFCQLDLVEGLQLGTPYGVIVRSLTQGVVSPNGEIRLIAMNAFVPETGIDEEFTTCGSTVDLNTVINAQNICAADFYTFRFTNLTDGSQEDLFYTRDDGLRSITLSWVTGLVQGDTYAVQVLGGSGGLVGDYAGSCELTISGGAAPIAGIAAQSSSISSNVEMELYPNPTVGDEVMLTLNKMDSEQQEVLVEIHDLYGKKVHSELLGNNGSQLTAVIQLPELAMGIYTVNVMVNQERIQAKKLVVR